MATFVPTTLPLLAFFNRIGGLFVSRTGKPSDIFWAREHGYALIRNGEEKNLITAEEAAKLHQEISNAPMFETFEDILREVSRTSPLQHQVNETFSLSRCCVKCPVHGWYPRAELTHQRESLHMETMYEVIFTMNELLGGNLITIDTALVIIQKALVINLVRTPADLNALFQKLPEERQKQISFHLKMTQLLKEGTPLIEQIISDMQEEEEEEAPLPVATDRSLLN